MPMAIVTGTMLVLFSWLACLAMVMGTGLVPALIVSRGRWTAASPRVALWWGLVILACVTVSLSLAVPMRGEVAARLVIGIVAVLTAVGAVLVARLRRSGADARPRRGRWPWIIAGCLLLAMAYLAAAALGPVTNYDSGLYHLGAISYAGDFAAIPGLANLYFPLGYANAEFPLAALLGNGPWDGVGYRLLNGLLLALVMVDLALRARRGRLTVGFYVLAAGLAAALVPMIALADYWVTSPTSDSAVLAICVAASAYLSDAVASGRHWLANASVAVVLSVLMVMLRPTMAVYAVAVIAVLVIRGWRARGQVWRAGSWAGFLLTATLAILAGLVISARDYVLSGWLQYPLSVFAFDVPWQAADPTDVRVPTLGAARDPSDLWAAADGWGWIGSWLGRLPTQWETFEFAALSVAGVVLLLGAHRARAGIRMTGLLLAMAPSGVAVAFWWAFTPPSFRFIWGPLFTLATIPIGWALWRLVSSTAASGRSTWLRVTVAGLAIPVVAVAMYSAAFRLDRTSMTEERRWQFGISIPYAVAPITDAPVAQAPLQSGITLLVPTDSDQCWSNYPLCSPMAPPTLRPRGDGLGAGFLP